MSSYELIRNIWSGGDEEEPEGGFIQDMAALQYKIDAYKRNLTPELIARAKRLSEGGIQYRSIGKDQIYSITIKNIWDQIMVAAAVLTDAPSSDFGSGFTNTVDFLRNTNITDSAMEQFMNIPGMDYEPKLGTRGGREVVINPTTNRSILTSGKTYKKLFGKIKLKHVHVEPEYVFKTVEYEIDEYCVPSYLKKYLPKKHYKLIDSQLRDNPTPTYPELTTILNALDIGLNVYIADKECIQKQEGHKKDINILIRNEHMYVVQKTLFTKNKVMEVSPEEFNKYTENKNVSQYSNSTLIYDGNKINIKYDDKTTEASKFLKYNSTFSTFNINFYNDCKIRATKYYNPKINHLSGVDLNACYINILRNEAYNFPIHTGHEITTEYKNEKIHDTSFYYVKFINPNDDIIAIFGSECWIMGFTLNNLNLKYSVHYEHKVYKSDHGRYFAYKKKGKIYKDLKYADDDADIGDVKVLDYVNALCITGQYASYKTIKETQYNSYGLERDALRLKYRDESGLSKNGVRVSSATYKKKASLYVYLGIVSYSKYQLYLINQEVKKLYNTAKIAKIQTDYVGYNIELTSHDIMVLNKSFEKHKFIVKPEHSTKSFTHSTYLNNVVNQQIKELKTYKEDKIISLLDKDKSFFLMGRGGYGKTWTIKNTIIPHLNMTNKKYILSSTTNANAQEIEGVAIQSILFNKEQSLERLEEYFKDIDYLIIDEASQMTLDVITTLNHLKLTIGLNIIASGDINQCRSVDAVVSWLHSYTFKHMVDHKFIQLEWKDVGRYSKDYDEFLDSIINCNNKNQRIKLIKQYFKGQKVRDGNENQTHRCLVYTHDKGKLQDAYKTEGKNAYSTVHSVQGESIDEIHNIYEIEDMPKDVLYTALSRTKKKEHVRIILKKKE